MFGWLSTQSSIRPVSPVSTMGIHLVVRQSCFSTDYSSYDDIN